MTLWRSRRRGAQEPNRRTDESRSECRQSGADSGGESRGRPAGPPDRRVGEDWLFRWRDLAGRTSSETLQSLWGSVLAGEVKSPGSFSLRTLDFLKSLSQEEAKQVERLAPFVIQKEFVAYDPPASGVLESQGTDYGFLKSLADLGVVSSARRGASRSIPSQQPDRFETGLIAYRRVLVVRHEDAKKTVNLGAYAVTPIGREVLGLGAFQPNEAHLRGVGEAIKRQGFEVLLARWTQLTETSGQYSDPEEL
ncbi:MAG: DUF2806 domain-containing protein [Acidobacteriia bacterium]|nr:DUF2806 domain-containing protein [Terriglobia bacterium]MYG01523.1 DUF2806 domain-containing protein [Terriglobia bacterium]MYK08788.1 DUF2806 domain-containing protein [Terriglobia bacterium]